MNREHVLEILFPRQQDQRRENDGHHHHADVDGDLSERDSEDGGTGGPCRIDELRFASEMREERDEDAETDVATSLDVDVEVASPRDRPPKEAHPLSSRPRTKRTASPPGREKEPKDRRSISPMCVICLERIGNSQMVSGLCQHRYHYDCLMEWMKKSHNDCPTCRQLLWDEGAFQDILREHNGGDAVIHTENPTTRTQSSQPRQPQQSQEQPGRRRRRQMERAGFPWRILCYVVNILMFIAGAGYLVASIVMGNGNNNNNNNNSRIDMDMEDSLCNQVGLRVSANTSNVGMLGSCEGSWACLEADPCVSIGFDSCNGEEACERLRVNVGNNSCQGPRACKGPLVNIGDNACIGIEACACRRPMEGIPGFNYDDDVPAGRCATQDECCLLADPLT